MGRTVIDAPLTSPAARSRLPARSKPHYRSLEPGLHLGYRRIRGKPGTWLARFYIGEQQYHVEALVHPVARGTVPCVADDLAPADGLTTLTYAQAVEKARARHVERARRATGIVEPATVAIVLDDYFDWLDAHGKGGNDAHYRAKVHIYPALGAVKLEDLTTDRLHQWHAGLARTPPRKRTSAGAPQQTKITTALTTKRSAVDARRRTGR
jgi:hypothetical protein